MRLKRTVINIMYKFGQIEIESKKFNSIYEIQKDVKLEKIRISEGVVTSTIPGILWGMRSTLV